MAKTVKEIGHEAARRCGRTSDLWIDRAIEQYEKGRYRRAAAAAAIATALWTRVMASEDRWHSAANLCEP